MGNGSRIRFWLDLWCGIDPLRYSFPTLFDLAANKFETGGCLGPIYWER